MKKTLTTFIAIFLFAFVAKAQLPEVHITYSFDSLDQLQCSPPYLAFTIIGGTANGIDAINDSLIYLISWGDGLFSGDTIPFSVYGSNIHWFSNGGMNTPLQHNYTTSGIFDFKLLVWTKLSAAKDSLLKPNYKIIGTHCDSISGNLYKDLNYDCQFNLGEPLINNLPSYISLYCGNTQINNYVYQTNGYYHVNVPDGIPGLPLYKIKLNNTAAFVGICPVSGEYIIPNLPSIHTDFGFQCNNSSNDFAIDYTNARVVFSNLSGNLNFKVMNVSCNSGISNVKIVLDPKTHLGTLSNPVVSSVIPAITGDTIIYNNVSLNSFQSQYFAMNLTAIPSIQVGDTLRFKAIIVPQLGETYLVNNYDSIVIKVVASYDPNDIQVSPFGYIPNLTKLDYYIRFQNTGNDAASKVVILDTLDASLDINTITFKGSSHAVDMHKLPGNIVKFIFEPIYLPDSGANMNGSMGYVAFSVKPTGYLPIGTQIPNIAYIYFDGNPAVQTNTVINIIDTAKYDPDGIEEIGTATMGVIYPNPASESLNIVFKETLKNASLAIFDLSGRQVFYQECKRNTLQIPLQSIENGCYLIQLRNRGILKQQKLIISH